MYNAKAYAAASAASPLAFASIPRRDPGENDVQIEILYCGICHSDLHAVRNEWEYNSPTIYPIVPGHEIVGRVTQVGSAVTNFKAGDIAAVGCLVGSDRTCPNCRSGLENFCPNMVMTFNSPDPHTGRATYGGYSESIVVDQHFVLRVPANLDLAAAAPLLCAGITTYSPLRHWKVGKGTKAGVVGLGGLGHMAVKLAHAMGAHVSVFTTSPSKQDDALRLGADEVIISRDANQMAKHAGSFAFILDCVSAQHDINEYIQLLAVDGNLTLVGAPPKPLPHALQLGVAAWHASAAASQPASSAVAVWGWARRVTARLASSVANWPPAITALDWPTLALLPDSTVRAWPIWSADRPYRPDTALRPAPLLKAPSSAWPTADWLPPSPDIEPSVDCRFSVTLVLP